MLGVCEIFQEYPIDKPIIECRMKPKTGSHGGGGSQDQPGLNKFAVCELRT
jgi:hypothetical protein